MLYYTAEYTVLYSVCTLHGTLDTMDCKLYKLSCTLYTLYCTLYYTLHYPLYFRPYSVYSTRYDSGIHAWPPFLVAMANPTRGISILGHDIHLKKFIASSEAVLYWSILDLFLTCLCFICVVASNLVLFFEHSGEARVPFMTPFIQIPVNYKKPWLTENPSILNGE